MGYYRGAETPDRWKAAGGVFAVHVALAAVIVSGLNVDIVTRTVDRLSTFDIADDVPPPPVPEPPPPKPQESSAPKEEAAPANIKSKPTPVVDPKPKIVIPTPVPLNTSKVRGPEGADRTAGARVPGTGTGAGGQGSGFGGGGSGGSGKGAGSGVGFTPAQQISTIPNREYRRLKTASGRRSGSVGITIKVNTDGRGSNCRVARSSGDHSVDSLMCQLAVQHVRFSPARDPQGQPVAQDITWYPNWSPNY